MIGSLLSAIAFLTRIPVPASVHSNDAGLRRSTRWFPAVGFLLGLIYAGTAALALRYFHPPVVAALLLAIDAVLTGSLHLDGLADMADGFGGGRTREDVLRIMRDHSIGSYGGVALAVVLLFKAACLADLVGRKYGLAAIVVAPALARWSILLLSRFTPYARHQAPAPAEGTGGFLTNSRKTVAVLSAPPKGPASSFDFWWRASAPFALLTNVTRTDLLFGSITCLILPFFFGFRQTVVCWAGVAGLSLVLRRICVRRIGGFTGDTLGATVVLSEAFEYAIALLVSPR